MCKTYIPSASPSVVKIGIRTQSNAGMKFISTEDRTFPQLHLSQRKKLVRMCAMQIGPVFWIDMPAKRPVLTLHKARARNSISRAV